MMTKDRYLNWVEEADRYAEEQFGLTAAEVQGGEDPDEYDVLNYDPETWVELKAEKYDLIRLERALGSVAPLSTLGYTAPTEEPVHPHWRPEHPEDMHQYRFNPYWDTDD